MPRNETVYSSHFLDVVGRPEDQKRVNKKLFDISFKFSVY